MGVDEELSPSLLEKVSYLGAKLCSFRDAHESISRLLPIQISLKRVERITERIGQERVFEREAEIADWQKLPLVQRDQAPPGVKAPDVVAVYGDGGRFQMCEQNADASSHWHEYKAGVLQSLESQEHASDPCPEIPDVYLQQERISKLAREITHLAAAVETSGADSIEAQSSMQPECAPVVATAEVRSCGYEPPQVIDRDVVASCRDSHRFGQHLAARARSLGFFAAQRKAWISDAQNWLFTEWERHFKAFGFVIILDYIHVLSRIFAAAMAGRSPAVGWVTYKRWITWVWNGETARVIAELAARQQELGIPLDEDGETSPRRVISSTLTYLQNHQGRMNYPEYRRLGLPITSAHMESTVKLLNRRIKGSEKFWSEWGGEAVLQLAADQYTTTKPLDAFWAQRPSRQSGSRTYANSRT